MGGEKPEEHEDEGRAATIARSMSGETLPATESEPELDLAVDGTIGRYRLVSRLGAGAMGVVWCALDPQLDRRVAIKVVHGKLARSPEASSRLLREARAMAKLSHRAVVTVHDAGETDGRLFVAMELVEGTTLGQMLRARSKDELRDWRRWLDMLLAAGRGLEAAHGAGVLHRDFKPDNVLVDQKGRVCVADFGLATLGGERPQPISERVSKARLLDLTTTGALLGTPAYMSPQQLRGEQIDERADQFSFCVAAFEALYGARPFEASGHGLDIADMLAVLERAIEHADVRPVPAESPVPDAVLEVLRRGLAADPEQRWTSMTTLLAALERAAKGKRTVTSMPAAQPPPASRLFMLVAVAASALAILAVVAVVLVRRDDAPATTAAPVAKRLYDVPLKTLLAATPDGRRIVLASDRLEVREVDGTRMWTTSVNAGDYTNVALTNTEVIFGVRGGANVTHWRYATDNAIVTELDHSGASWVGQMSEGHLFYKAIPGSAIRLESGGKLVREFPTTNIAELFAVSPDMRQVAILEAQRFSGEIVVRDVEGKLEVRSPMLDSPTAITWEDDQHLIYATGTMEKPALFRVRVDARGFGPPQKLYGLETGWFGELAVGGGRLFFVEMGPKSRARLIDSATQLTRELDAANVGAALAWTGDDEFLAWNRNTKRVERRTASGKLELTDITLDGEPANTTLAGGVLIAAIRTNHGREIVAHELSTGTRLWKLPAGTTHAVRCANDRHPPCFALRSLAGHEEVVPVDSRTGALGASIFSEMIEDIAVDDAGARIAAALRAGILVELAPDGKELQRFPSKFAPARSLAYDKDGSFLMGGTIVRNTFQVARYSNGKLTPIAQAENELLSIVRPSNDGQRILVLARVYSPVLWELALP